MPHTTGSPCLMSRSFRQTRDPSSNDDHGVHALALDLDPASAVSDGRPLVRGGVEVLRRAAVLVGRPERRVLLGDGMAAQRHQLLDQLLERRARLAP